MRTFCSRPVLALVAAFVWLALGLAPALAQQGNNECDDTHDAPDVIVGDLVGVVRWGQVAGISAFSVGTTSCNVGTCWLEWFGDTNRHPVIGQSMYRLKDGRFEQIGQSWLKHGFFALSEERCNEGCIPTDGTHLGVNCSDPYSASLNGIQGGLGPKFEVNPVTGGFAYPPTDGGATGDAIYKRLQVRNTDLSPALNPNARYFFEGQYITPDDAFADNNDNNASHREALVFQDDIGFGAILLDETQRGLPALTAWGAIDPEVVTRFLDVDGRFIVAAKVTSLGSGLWGYEYAVQNLNSHRGAARFEVPLPAGAPIQGIGFHDVDYHSGEPFDGTDWTVTLDVDGPGPPSIRWTTEEFGVNENANALRWGTTYNFRFITDVPPGDGEVGIGLFRPGTPPAVTVQLPVPAPCNQDGVCDIGETCENCAADCVGSGVDPTCCGDDVCEGAEDECSCVADCGPCIVSCNTGADCDDGDFCNGTELCVNDVCEPGARPCGDLFCDEEIDECFACLGDIDCDDGNLCNGIETCTDGMCQNGPDPCPGQFCDPARSVCVDCLENVDCDDGVFCNGTEICQSGTCTAGTDPCPPDTGCDEENDLCLECAFENGCDDGLFCNGVEDCFGEVCIEGERPCDPDQSCDEIHDVCGAQALQPATGRPLNGLSPTQLAAFAAGRDAFESLVDQGSGLGPIYNWQSCSGCHQRPTDLSAAPTITKFGHVEGEVFDPLSELGGSLLQLDAIRPECGESLPAEANFTGSRRVTGLYGAGLVDHIPDSEIRILADTPPTGVSGRVHEEAPFEDPGTLRIGRYGWKAQFPTLLSATAAEARDEIGLTSELLPTENAPNGNQKLLAACDEVADPEDVPRMDGGTRIGDWMAYLKYLAPPPQTPRTGRNGEVQFFSMGCNKCHRSAFATSTDTSVESILRGRTIKPYSDYLLHDMGENGEPTAEGDAAMGEVRTTPLWGLRNRTSLWHDGRISGGTFEERVSAAIALHDSPGSEAQASAQSFAATSQAIRNVILQFLGSLGRREFDYDGDGDVDTADFETFDACFTGPGFFYSPNAPCAIHDFDRDADVDDRDYAQFLDAFDGSFGGSVPDGAEIPGDGLRIDRQADGSLLLSWGESCVAEDPDYAVYQGILGGFYNHFPRTCSTGGATSQVLAAPSASVYFLVAPTNGYSEGAYGKSSFGVPRPHAAGLACAPRVVSQCD